MTNRIRLQIELTRTLIWSFLLGILFIVPTLENYSFAEQFYYKQVWEEKETYEYRPVQVYQTRVIQSPVYDPITSRFLGYRNITSQVPVWIQQKHISKVLVPKWLKVYSKKPATPKPASPPPICTKLAQHHLINKDSFIEFLQQVTSPSFTELSEATTASARSATNSLQFKIKKDELSQLTNKIGELYKSKNIEFRNECPTDTLVDYIESHRNLIEEECSYHYCASSSLDGLPCDVQLLKDSSGKDRLFVFLNGPMYAAGSFKRMTFALDYDWKSESSPQIMSKLTFRNSQEFARNQAEMALANQVQGPGLAGGFIQSAHGSESFLLQDYFNEGSLSSKSNLNRPDRQKLGHAWDILNGLRKLHEQGLVHRDIKPENILVKNNRAFISDFGLTIHKTDREDGASTPYFKSPELAAEEVANHPSPSRDIWATGLTLLNYFYPQRFENSVLLKFTNQFQIILALRKFDFIKGENAGNSAEISSQQIAHLNSIYNTDCDEQRDADHRMISRADSSGNRDLKMTLVCQLMDPDPNRRLSAADAKSFLENHGLVKIVSTPTVQ